MRVLGVCSIRIFAKNIGNPYYEPTIKYNVNQTDQTTFTESQLTRELHMYSAS